MQAGVTRWRERFRLAKSQGLVEKFPTGRRPRGAPRAHPDKLIRKAQRIIKRRIEQQAEMAKLHAVPGEEGAAEQHLETVAGCGGPGLPGEDEPAVNSAASEDAGNGAQDMLEDFMIALLELPGRNPGASCLWHDIIDVLPDELFERLDAWLEKSLRTSPGLDPGIGDDGKTETETEFAGDSSGELASCCLREPIARRQA
jgi:hypothetical protein